MAKVRECIDQLFGILFLEYSKLFGFMDLVVKNTYPISKILVISSIQLIVFGRNREHLLAIHKPLVSLDDFPNYF